MAKDSQRGSSADDERELPDEPATEDAVDDVEPSDDADLDETAADDSDEQDDPDLDDSDEDDESDEDEDDAEVAAAAAGRGKKSKSSATATKKKAATSKQSAKERKASPIAGAAAGTFIQQVVSELSKVVWPTKKQMITYTTVVMVFVVVLVAAVWGFDLGVGKVMDWIFA